jgi:hypothetical protein
MLQQRILLEQEGVTVRGGRVRLERHQWRGPRGARRLRVSALGRL